MSQRGIHILVGHHAQHHTNIPEEGGNDDTLDDNEPQNVPRSGAYGLTDAKFVGTLLDGDEHDIRHAHDTAEQSKQAYHPEEGTDDIDTLFHLQVLRETVPYPYSLLVLRMCLMLSIQTATIVFLKVIVSLLRCQPVESKLDASGIVGIGTINRLDGGVRREPVSTPVLLFLIDAHNLKGKVADIDVRAYLRFQFIGLLITDNQHLAFVFQVYLINEAAIQYLHLVYLSVIGIDATDAGGDILLTQADGG